MWTLELATYLALTIFAVAAVLVFRRLSKGVRRSATELRRPIADLLKRGYDGGILIIQHTRSEIFLQFRKYIRSRGDYGIELGFPRAKWSEEYFSRLSDYCDDHGIDYILDPSEQAGPIQFLHVDFGQDYDRAYWFTKNVLRDIFNLSSEATYYVHLNNASPRDELIDHRRTSERK